MFAELASMWLAGESSARPGPGPAVETRSGDPDLASKLRVRIPLLMAVWGFAFVAVGELVLHLIRSRKPTPPPTPPRQPDDAEKLLEQLLAEVEAKAKLPTTQTAGTPTTEPTTDTLEPKA